MQGACARHSFPGGRENTMCQSSGKQEGDFLGWGIHGDSEVQINTSLM